MLAETKWLPTAEMAPPFAFLLNLFDRNFGSVFAVIFSFTDITLMYFCDDETADMGGVLRFGVGMHIFSPLRSA